ncbi:MAG: 16S rRNA (adenine(1518)-N(6)/adenine(1519)-N(6))-dimethyltransferase RsmA [Lachnospiraceae bacterium]|nr:16S rRNA (adenine(1518)-N(6)/adenine(1519)-N(6))-dimethyltransferase RsmA [Lachnospiraceae bacterium]
MDRLANAGNTLNIIKQHDFSFRKKYGQNFLIDTNILERIIKEAGVSSDDHVLEIGPGIGALTQYLCESAGTVTAVEIDKELIPILKETLGHYDNLKVINEDIMKTDIHALIREECGGGPVKVVANLPYYITTPIIMTLLESHAPISGITIMVQKEVAERMTASPGSKDYGALTLAVNYYSRPRIAFTVPPSCFMPRPKVASSVICLEPPGEDRVKVKDEEHMFKLIRAAFNQRRKTLANSIANGAGINRSKQEITEALEGMGLGENIRGEALDLEQFAALSDRLIF